jgi:dTDP-glucose 4,6-dehydratase
MAVVSRNPTAFQASAPHIAADNAIAMIRADLRSSDFGAAVRSRYDVVVHAATASSAELAGGGPQAIADTVEETRRVLDVAVNVKARRVLYLSSGAVYGRQPQDLSHIPEDFDGRPELSDPSSNYGMTKRAGEFLCSSYAGEHRVETVIARGFACIGPLLPLGQKFAAGAFLSDVLRGRPVHIQGDGTPVRSYLYAGDLAAWLWIILLRGEPGRAYNVGSERAISIGELAREAASLAEPPLQVEIEGTPDLSRQADRLVQ